MFYASDGKLNFLVTVNSSIDRTKIICFCIRMLYIKEICNYGGDMCITMENNFGSYHVNLVQCFTPLQPFELKNNQCDVNDKQGIENKLIHVDDIAYNNTT